MRSVLSSLACALALIACAYVAAAPVAFVPNEGSGTVSVIDTATDRVASTITTGGKPRGIAIAPDGKRLYVSDQTANGLAVFDVGTNAAPVRVSLGDSPEGIYLSPDGRRLAAAIEENNQVLIVDTATLAIGNRVAMRGRNPEHAVWSPDARWIYVSAEEADSVDIVDVARGEVVKSITVGERPTVLANYTKDTDLLRKQTDRLFPRTGAGAYLLDAILDASRGLAKRESDRKAMLAITFEGVDYSNRHYQVVLDELKKTGAALHVIAIGTPSSSLSDEMRNRNMVIAEGTDRTGGRRDQVLAVSGIPDKLKQAADELVGQYLLTYGRPDTLIPGEKLEVRSTRPNVTVRAPTRLINR